MWFHGSLRMQECRDESEIYNYPQIQLWDNKFINGVLAGGRGGVGGRAVVRLTRLDCGLEKWCFPSPYLLQAMLCLCLGHLLETTNAQLWMERKVEGSKSFCSPKYLSWRQCCNNFVAGCDVCTSHTNSILILYARMKE